MKRTALAALAACLLGSGAAFAQGVTGGFYAGGSIGQSDVDASITAPLITSGQVDGKDTAFKIFGGYQANPYFALELQYVDLGSVAYSGNFLGLPVVGGQVDINGMGFAVLGSWPVSDKFSVHGKIGLWSWQADAHDTTAGLPFSGSADGSDLFYGIGASYQFTRHLGVRVEWEQYKLDSDNANLISVGVLYRF